MDPKKFCRTCGKSKPRQGFRSIPGKIKREVCSDCFQIKQKAEKRIKFGDIPADKVPF